jgi:hypothetical protein
VFCRGLASRPDGFGPSRTETPEQESNQHASREAGVWRNADTPFRTLTLVQHRE